MSARKPAALRALEGNPGQRKLPNEPKAPPLLADPPDTLGPCGRELWCRVRDAFDAPVVLDSDYAALLSLCQAWEIAQAAAADLRERGPIIESKRADRELVRNLSMLVWGAASERVNKYLVAFGLTPAARASFDLPKPAQEQNALDLIRASTRRAKPGETIAERREREAAADAARALLDERRRR